MNLQRYYRRRDINYWRHDLLVAINYAVELNQDILLSLLATGFAVITGNRVPVSVFLRAFSANLLPPLPGTILFVGFTNETTYLRRRHAIIPLFYKAILEPTDSANKETGEGEHFVLVASDLSLSRNLH